MARKAVTAILIILAALYCLATIHVKAPIDSLSDGGTVLPDCQTEDGAGQVLCLWKGSQRGNGEGADIVSGDCAGTGEAMNSCAALWARNGGPKAISECRDIQNAMLGDSDVAAILNGDGWTLTECFDSFLE